LKVCLDGNGNNSTAAVAAYLLNNPKPLIKTLYLIGHPEDPFALWLTDYESPVLWSLYGTFLPAVVSRGSVTTKIGLDATSLDISWTPKTPWSFGATTASASPIQLAQQGFYDNWPVYVWNVYMPTPGDANTLGCSQLFGGIIGSTSVDRSGIKFTVNSFLYVLNTDIPGNVIEMTNTLASFLGMQPPAGFSTVPTFEVSTGIAQSPSVIYSDCLNPSGHVWAGNTFTNGFLIFITGTLAGYWAAIGQSEDPTVAGHQYNQFTVYNPFPWAPSPGDTFAVSTAFPTDQSETTDFYGFPFVPDPTTAV
jgi:hypothetical protein